MMNKYLLNFIVFITMFSLPTWAEEPVVVPEDDQIKASDQSNNGSIEASDQSDNGSIEASDQSDNESVEDSDQSDNELTEIKLVPQIRRESLTEAPPYTIPLHIIRPFLSQPRIMELEEFEETPRVVGFAREHIAGGAGDEIYVDNIDEYDVIDNNFEILRLGQAYIDPDSEDVLGYEAIYVGNAEILKSGQTPKLLITQANREVQIDDRIMPAREDDLAENFIPSPASSMIEGKIITVLDGVNEISTYSLVAINKGEEDGLKYGNTLEIIQQPVVPCTRPLPLSVRSYNPISCGDDFNISAYVPSLIDSNDENPELPYEVVGNLMVFRIFEHVSYAIVLHAINAINVGDGVRGGGA